MKDLLVAIVVAPLMLAVRLAITHPPSWTPTATILAIAPPTVNAITADDLVTIVRDAENPLRI